MARRRAARPVRPAPGPSPHRGRQPGGVARAALLALAVALLAHRLPARVLTAFAAAVEPASFVSFEEARPLLDAARDALPAGLAGRTDENLASAWPGWVRERDRAVRERLVRGEEDALVNLLLFGTSFTRAPRLTSAGQAGLSARDAERALARRLQDLVLALASPGSDERLVLSRSLLDRLGLPVGAPGERERVGAWLVENVARVRREQARIADELGRVRALPDATERMAARSTLFRDRGIALDTSLRPAFALDEALRDAMERGLVTAASVRRVAVVGPGLDFVEKAEGQDFYPPQSMQALALADSLVRLGLSRTESLSVTAFDISPRVLDHLERARSRAAAGEGYLLQLPRPREGWAVPFVAYWERFGDAVAVPAEAVKPPASAGPLAVRAVRVRPEVVAAVHPLDLNVVYQRLDLPPAERFDLVVATNILVYYDTFEQCLALANVARVTTVGGLFLSNNVVLELPGSTLRSVGYTTVVFSDRPDDGEHVVFYRRLPDPTSR
jgi:SAM-dependent methyltransferase